MGEWKRIFHWKMNLLIIGIIVFNIMLFSYQQLTGRSLTELKFSTNENIHLIERYRDLEPDAALEKFTKEQQAINRYIRQLKEVSQSDSSDTEVLDNAQTIINTQSKQSSQSVQGGQTVDNSQITENYEGIQEMVDYYSKLSDIEKDQMIMELKNMKEKLTYISGYNSDITSVLANAEKLKRFALFSNPDSFSYNNILKTASDFSHVKDVTLALTNDRAVKKFVGYYYIFYLAFAIMVIAIYNLFKERENGMWAIVHSSSKGRGEMAIKRLFLILTGSFVITGLLYFSTLIASLIMYGGWGDLNSPIQTIDSFKKFMYSMSKLQYIINNFFISWVAVFALSVAFWMLFVVFRNRNHTLVLTGIFLGVEILLFQKIQVQSIFNYLKYINIVNTFRLNEIYSTYNNWGFGTHVFRVFHITFAVLIIIFLLSGIVAIVRTIFMRPESKTTIVHKFFSRMYSHYQKIFTYKPVTLKELHKLIITGKGLWVIAVVIIIAAYFCSIGTMHFSDSQKSYDKMYLEHGGKEYVYIVDYVNQEKQFYLDAVSNLSAVSQQYVKGEVELKVLVSATSNIQYALTRFQAVQEFIQKSNYLDKIKNEQGIDGYMMSDRGYEEIFGNYSTQREFILLIILIAGIMLIITESISMEYRTGMDNIVRSCDRGRGWLIARKVLACFICTGLMFLIVYAIDYIKLYQIYGMPYLDSPLQSLTFMESCKFKGTIIQWIGIKLFVRYIACLITMTIAIIVSKIIGKKGSRSITILVLALLLVIITLVYKKGIF